MTYFSNIDIVDCLAQAAERVGGQALTTTLRTINKDFARAGERFLFRNLILKEDDGETAIEVEHRLKGLLDLCQGNPRIKFRIRALRLIVNGYHIQSDRWLLSHSFSTLTRILGEAGSRPLDLSVIRTKPNRPINGAFLEEAIQPIAHRVRVLHLIEIDALYPSFFSAFTTLDVLTVKRVVLLPPVADKLLEIRLRGMDAQRYIRAHPYPPKLAGFQHLAAPKPTVTSFRYSGSTPFALNDRRNLHWDSRRDHPLPQIPERLHCLLDFSQLRTAVLSTSTISDRFMLDHIRQGHCNSLQRLTINVEGLYRPRREIGECFHVHRKESTR